MKKVTGFIMIISICVLLTGCSRKNEHMTANENVSESEMFEEETANQKPEEQITFEQDIYDEKLTESEDWEQEMYDPGAFEEEITYPAEDYGEIQEYGSEFYYEEDVMGYYYNMENFYLNSDFLYTMNDTLQEFYDAYLHQYRETENWYMEAGEQELPEGKVPYSELKFLGVQYVDNDYISLLFNDVTYMGGAQPYYMFDAITVDRSTGEEVSASRILGESDTEILEKVTDLMGLDVVGDWESIDFYLKEGKIVFFYRMPGYWEDVVLGR